MKEIWRSISEWVSQKVEWILEKLKTWKNAISQIGKGGGTVVVKSGDGGGGGGSPYSATGFAKGGIVTKPTLAWIGEAGFSEAVLPLPKLQPMMTEALLGAVEALSGGSNITTNRQINLSVINKGTIVGRNGMEDFAKTVSKQISKDFGLAIGGAW